MHKDLSKIKEDLLRKKHIEIVYVEFLIAIVGNFQL